MVSKAKGKGRGGKRQGAGRPPGRENNRTILLRQGLDEMFPDPVYLKMLHDLVTHKDTPKQVCADVLIQIGKWKGYTDRHEIVADTLPADGIFRSFLSSGEAALAPPRKGGDGPASG